MQIEKENMLDETKWMNSQLHFLERKIKSGRQLYELGDLLIL